LFDDHDLREDPQSAEIWTFGDFSARFEGRGYSASDVVNYWRDTCVPVGKRVGDEASAGQVDTTCVSSATATATAIEAMPTAPASDTAVAKGTALKKAHALSNGGLVEATDDSPPDIVRKIGIQTEMYAESSPEACNEGPSETHEESSSVDNSTVADDDVRVDPDTGRSWTFRNFRDNFVSEYSESQIKEYWQVACSTPASKAADFDAADSDVAKILSHNNQETPVSQIEGVTASLGVEGDETTAKDCMGMEGKGEQYGIAEDDVRRDPDSGKVWKFKDFHDYFESSYSATDVCLYWNVACHPAIWCGDVSQYVLNLVSRVLNKKSSNAHQDPTYFNEQFVHLQNPTDFAPLCCPAPEALLNEQEDFDFLSSDSSEIDEAEEGVDPENAAIVTFGDVLDQYHGEYSEKDLRVWWRSNCKIDDAVSSAEDCPTSASGPRDSGPFKVVGDHWTF